jgi:hypothetical protein
LICELHPKANKPKPPYVGEKNPKTQKKINTSKSSNTSDTKQTFKTSFRARLDKQKPWLGNNSHHLQTKIKIKFLTYLALLRKREKLRHSSERHGSEKRERERVERRLGERDRREFDKGLGLQLKEI